MTNDDPSSSRTLKTVETASEVINRLVEMDGAGVTNLAERIELSKSTVHAYLKTLQQQGLVIKEDEKYRLSRQFILLGEYVRNNNLLYQAGRDEATDLADDIGHYAHLVVEEDGQGISVYQAKGKKAADYDYQTAKLQQPDPLHVTASGKAILAHLSHSRIQKIIGQYGLEQRTKNTITDPNALLERVERIRERGFAYNDEEEIEGFRAVGAPIKMADGTVLGSISVSGPTSYLDDTIFRETLPEQVMNTASIIEVNINMMEKQN